jgi:disulfide bond formation protein DsbB
LSTDQVSLFLGLLALLAEIAAVVLVAALVVRAARPRTGWAAELLDAVRPVALGVAAVVAIVSMLGSLYYSEVANFPPCRLCWYQRIGMYPLAVVGGLVSIYHVLIERYPSLESGSCDPTNPCSIIWVERLGYLTIPTMALSGFAVIAVLLLLPKEIP